MSPVETLRAPAKLTRSLRVVGIRHDGYHLLEAEMATLDLADEIELEPGGEGFEVLDEVDWAGVADGAPSPVSSPAGRAHAREVGRVPEAGPANLVARALEAVGRRARVRLKKRIPAGAGLGGGSADAAAILRWAGVRDAAVAAGLGADVPFCVTGGRALVRGVGELVEPLSYEPFGVVLLTPALAVATPEVYRAWDALGCPAGEHGNDLESAALAIEPGLSWWRDLFSSVAGERPHLAGSGGTWYLERERSAAVGLAAQLRGAVLAERGRALVAAAASTPSG